MTTGTVRSRRALVTAALVVASIAGPIVPSSVATDDATSVVFDDPGSDLRAGSPVQLHGRVTRGGTGAPTVLYVVDASASTGDQRGADCDGNGVVDAGDDLNGDHSVGDVLDCEIAAVRSLNQVVAGSVAGSNVGLEAFATQPAIADLDPSAVSSSFVPAGQAGTGAEPWIVTAARGVKRGIVRQYTKKSLGGTGTDLDAAASSALSTLAAAPGGPKWVFFLSDGKAAVNASTLAALHTSGVSLRSFAIGSAGGCDAGRAMARMAAATGESCMAVRSSADLPGHVVGSQPDAITGVTLEVGGRQVQADVDAFGGWSTTLVFGAGSYNATVTATMKSGATVRAVRSFMVAAGDATPAGAVILPPGTHPVTGPPVARAVQIARVRYNPPGPDTRRNARAEFVVVKNTGVVTVGLKGWTVRDASGHVYTFPATTLRPRGTVLVRTGKGTNRSGVRFWGRNRHVWNNHGRESARLRDGLGRAVDSCYWNSTGATKVVC